MLLGTQMCFLGALAKKIALLLGYSFAETGIAGIFDVQIFSLVSFMPKHIDCGLLS